jgi:hypothetical protein
MVFIFHPIEVLQIRPHLARGFGDLSHFYMLELVEAKNGLGHLVIEQRIPAFALELWQDTHAVA